MNNTRLSLAIILAMATPALLLAQASPPGVVNYQGVLRDATGAPIDAGVTMSFNFYDDAAGSNLLLTDDHGTVTVSGGLFNVALGSGSITPGLSSNLSGAFRDYGAAHMELVVGGETLSPMVEVRSAPYALNPTRQSDVRLVVITSNTYSSDFGGLLTNADAACQASADAAGLGGTYMAWLSNSSGSPSTRFTRVPDLPYVLLDGTEIASDYADLTDGALAAAIDIDEFGATVADGTMVWTGTRVDGTAASSSDHCSEWNAAGPPAVGRRGETDALMVNPPGWWTYRGSIGCGSTLRLYCFQQDLNDSTTNYRLALIGSDLELEDARGTLTADLSALLDNTDAQTLSFTLPSLSISGGNSADLSALLDNTDAQTLSFTLPSLSISGGNSADLSALLDNTDAQTLSFTSPNLSISGGNSVDLSSIDADLLDGLDSTDFMSASADDWVDEAGDSMSGGLILDASGSALTVTSGCIRFDGAGTGNRDFDLCNDDGSYPDEGVALRALTNPSNGDPLFRVMSSGGVERLRVEHSGALSTTNTLDVQGTGTSTIAGGLTVDGTLDVQGTGTSTIAGGLTVDGTTLIVEESVDSVGLGVTPLFQLHLSSNSAGKPVSALWTVASDRRLKKDIRPFGDGLDVLSRIQPIRYRYTGEGGLPTDVEGIGVIAQDLEPVAPYTIQRYGTVFDDETGRDEDALGVDAGPLLFVMINAINELDQRATAANDVLVRENEELRQHIRDLASRIEPPASVTGQPRDALDEPIGVEAIAAAGPEGTGVPAMLFRVSELVEPGDVLVMHPESKGARRLCNRIADPSVVGIAGGESTCIDEERLAEGGAVELEQPVTTDVDSKPSLCVPIASVGSVVACKVDAGYGAIEIGDLLTTSPTPGHAMRSYDQAPGTIVAKALEALDAGTGVIQVLVMLR